MLKRKLASLVAGAVLVGSLLLGGTAQAANPPKFKVLCKHSHFAQVDPIVAPGSPMSAHMHDFIGNTTTNEDSTFASMTAGDSTCSAVGDTAGYWIPTVLDGSTFISPQAVTVYYRGGPEGEHVTPFPPDFRVVTRVFVYPSSDETINVKFPPCWDGVHTDSTDHISHLAWPRNKVGASTGDCPTTHPVRVPAVSLNMRYRTPVQGETLSSGDASTMHADFWNTWDQDVLEALVDRCLNKGAGVDCGTIKDK